MATFNAMSPRLCLAVGCDLTLEPFTRGLTSEDADQHPQRFVAVIARRTLPCYGSRPLVASGSRTDHSAATPSLSLMFASRAERSRGHHVMPDVRRSRRSGQARQPARDGAKRSGLTGPRTAEQSRLVMAALVNDGDAQRENDATNETRKVGKQSGGDSGCCLWAAIRRKCAFTYMNAVSRRNLTDARAINANDVRTALDTGAAFGGVRHRAVSPDDRDMHVGSERPLEGRAWGEEGGSRMGVAHAPLPLCSAATAAPTAAPAAQGAAGSEPQAIGRQEHLGSMGRGRQRERSALRRRGWSGRGNGAPEFRFPPLVPPRKRPETATKKETRAKWPWR
jgi:hypothetical protein